MNNKKLITEQLGRIQEIMYGKNLLNENFIGNLTRQAVANSIRASIEAVMDDFVKQALKTTTKEAAQTAKGVIDDIIKGGPKAAAKVAQTSNKIYDDVARKAFGKSYQSLDDIGKQSIKNNVRIVIEEDTKLADDVIKSAQRASDDIASKTKKVATSVADDAGKQADDVVGDAGRGVFSKAKNAKETVKNYVKKAGNKWASMSRKQRILFLVGAGAAGYILWQFFKDETAGVFPDCINNGINETDLQKITEDGGENVIRTSTGVLALDNLGGVKFLKDGSAQTMDGSLTGMWSDSGSNITIVLNGQTYTMECVSTPVITPPIENVTSYKSCDSFPLTVGCKGDKVREFQKCINGIKADGYFGPKTQQGLIDNKYPVEVTQEIYDKIIKNCGKSATDGSGTPEKEFTSDVTFNV